MCRGVEQNLLVHFGLYPSIIRHSLPFAPFSFVIDWFALNLSFLQLLQLFS